MSNNAASDLSDIPESNPSRAFAWTALGWGGNKVLILLLTLILARLLTPADFGLVTAGLTVIAILDAALDLGLGAALVFDQERGVTRRVRVASGLNIAVCATVCALGAAVSPLTARVFGLPEATGLFATLFLYPLLRGFGQVSDALLKRDMRFRQRSLADLVRAVVRVGVSVPLALSGSGAWSIVLGVVISEAFASVLLQYLYPVRPLLRFARSEAAGLLSFGGAVTGVRLLGSLRSNIDYVVVGSALGASSLGYYGMAFRLPELVLTNMLWMFTLVAFPVYARARTTGKLVETMLKATRLVSLYGLAAGVMLAVLSRDAVLVLFSPEWAPAGRPMQLLCFALALMSIGWASGDVFSALGRPGLLLMLDIPATVAVCVAFGFAPRWGIVGVATVHLCFEACYAIARLVLAVRVTGVAPSAMLRAILPGAVTAVAVAAVGFPLRAELAAGSAISLLVLVLACGATAVVVGGLTARGDLRLVLGQLRNRTSSAPVEAAV